MALHLIRKVRDRQPTSFTNIARSKLAQGLIAGYVPTFGSVVRGDTYSLSGSAKLVSGSGGLAVGNFVSTGDKLNLPDLSGRLGNRFTIAVVLQNGTTSDQGFGDLSTNSEAEHYPYSGTVYASGGANDRGSFAPGFALTNPHCTVWVTDVNGTGNYQLAVSGGKLRNTTNPAGSTNGWNPSANLGDSPGYATYSGKFYGFFAWNRCLNLQEAESFSANPWQIFEPETIPLFFSTVTAQYARPTSDVSTGTWTASSGSDLFAMLDETTVSDADYIVTTGTSTCEVALGSLSDPSSSSGHVVRYRISADAGGITVRLRQGTTTIATWTHATAPTSLTTYAQTLTSGEADSITDYTALRLQFEAT